MNFFPLMLRELFILNKGKYSNSHVSKKISFCGSSELKINQAGCLWGFIELQVPMTHSRITKSRITFKFATWETATRSSMLLHVGKMKNGKTISTLAQNTALFYFPSLQCPLEPVEKGFKKYFWFKEEEFKSCCACASQDSLSESKWTLCALSVVDGETKMFKCFLEYVRKKQNVWQYSFILILLRVEKKDHCCKENNWKIL